MMDATGADSLMRSCDGVRKEAQGAMHKGITDHKDVSIANKEKHRMHLEVQTLCETRPTLDKLRSKIDTSLNGHDM